MDGSYMRGMGKGEYTTRSRAKREGRQDYLLKKALVEASVGDYYCVYDVVDDKQSMSVPCLVLSRRQGRLCLSFQKARCLRRCGSRNVRMNPSEWKDLLW